MLAAMQTAAAIPGRGIFLATTVADDFLTSADKAYRLIFLVFFCRKT